MADDNREDEESEDRPPIFASWNGAYSFVLGTLAALIMLFSFITRHYR